MKAGICQPFLLLTRFGLGMFINRKIVLLFVIVLLQSHIVHASDPVSMAPSAEEMYRMMREAMQSQPYKGTITFEQSGHLASYDVESQGENQPFSQRISSLSGEYFQRKLTASSQRCSPQGLQNTDFLATNEQSLQDLYNFYIRGESRIAGKVGYELLLLPIDKHRWGHEFVVEKESFLMLSHVVVKQNRQPLERIQFASIELGQQVSNVDAPTELIQGVLGDADNTDVNQVDKIELAGDEHYSSTELLEKTVTHIAEPALASSLPCDELVDWYLDWVPSGFDIVNVISRDNGGAKIVFSDQVVNFSLIVDAVEQFLFPSVIAHRGASTAITSNISTEAVSHSNEIDTHRVQQHFQATLVGTIPLDTARKMLDSLVAGDPNKSESGG